MPDKTYERITGGGVYIPPEPTKSAWNKYKWLLLIPVFLVQFYVLQNIAQKDGPPPYDPLGTYPQQEVLNKLPGIDEPSLRMGEALKTRGIKCNNSATDVKVTTERFWKSIDPRGTQISGGGGAGTRKPGCETLSFDNPIPAEVLLRTQQLLDQGQPYVVWQYSGIETPSERPIAVPRVWQTVEFRIYPAVEAG